MDFTYYSAVYSVKNALAKVKDEKGMKRVEKFLRQEICPACHGTRLSDAKFNQIAVRPNGGATIMEPAERPAGALSASTNL